MRYIVTWTMYFTDSNIPDTIAVAIVEAATVSKARYAAYKQMIHKLKILPQHFEDKLKGIKNWEIRNNDRPFKVDDILQLEEWSDETGYTGRMLQEYIKKIYADVSGIEDGYVIMNTGYIANSFKDGGE